MSVFIPYEYNVYKKWMGYISLSYVPSVNTANASYTVAMLEVCKQYNSLLDKPNQYAEGFAAWKNGVRTIVEPFRIGTDNYYTVIAKRSEGYYFPQKAMTLRYVQWKENWVTNKYGAGYQYPIYVGKIKLSFREKD